MPKPGPIDPNVGPKLVLAGDIVTMDDKATFIADGRLYVDQGVICAAQEAAAPAPAGFEGLTAIATGGTIYPGLIELHNHLSYDVLPLWSVPKTYGDRSQWQGTPAYRQLISGPMKVLGSLESYPEAVVRYVECKCLLGGVTTSQGVALFSFSGISTYYKGIVRNVERTDDLTLPSWKSHIADVAAKDAELFFNSLKHDRYLLHLSEGIDTAAKAHFEALHIDPNTWAITNKLAGIHCVALDDTDFVELVANGGSMVWSPLSNLLLYGRTADIASAKKEGVPMALGSDWSPSGSKNLFAELKVARVVAQRNDVFSDEELLRLATINAARILKWDTQLGSLEPNKRADLLVVSGTSGDPYGRLLDAAENQIALVMVNGVARYGAPALMTALAPPPFDGLEALQVGGQARLFDLRQATEFPKVAALSLDAAAQHLKDGLARLPELQSELLAKPVAKYLAATDDAPAPLMLKLEHDESPGMALRPHLDDTEMATAATALYAAPLAETLNPIVLDTICVSNDPSYGSSLDKEMNLPAYLKSGLQNIY